MAPHRRDLLSATEGSSKIDCGKGRPGLYRSIGLASNRSLAGLSTCELTGHSASPSLIILLREEAFRCIGFNLERMSNGQGELALHAPVLDSNTPEGPANRAKLLRAWIELSAWYADFTKRYGLFLRSFRRFRRLKITPSLHQRRNLPIIPRLGLRSRLTPFVNYTKPRLERTQNNVSATRSDKA